MWTDGFTVLKDCEVPGYMFDKRYRNVIPDRDVWVKNWLNQVRKGQILFVDGTCNLHGAEPVSANIEAKYNGIFH